MYKLLIIDDHASMREAIRQAFVATNRYQVVSELATSDLAEAYCQKLQPDLVITDVCCEHGTSGLEATQVIKTHFPTIKVIIITAFDELSYIPRAKKVGADAFIYKSKSLQYFIEVADKIMQGEKIFSKPKEIPLALGETPLTEREMEVLRLICKHMTNQEIATELYISENTVKYHKSNMLAKTGFTKIIDLAFYMLSNGYINPLY
ncbi:two component transcriptional regulator, LuxR family [Granulicatella balaenopterae]|uniref:Two component transcriptional regulator, LuxR family n=1 Tax=Granulicatella balaenopterae TaxID=137733 RepID=A0A1H9ISH8_9LACT|nr:response regulator transcription factor [Granulicatella balaenopterae]SEQ77477.1 two component transcriptional regulator, LuxR family [Granulicatella balaenopterae]